MGFSQLFNLFSGKEGFKTMFGSPGKCTTSNSLCGGVRISSRESSYRPDFLRLNSSGELGEDTLSPDTNFCPETVSFQKGILGHFTENISAEMDSQQQSHQNPFLKNINARKRPFTDPMAMHGMHGYPVMNQQYYPPFGIGLQRPPMPQMMQQYGSWGYQPWLSTSHGPLLGNPFGNHGFPVGFPPFQGPRFHQGQPLFSRAPSPMNHWNTPRKTVPKHQCHKKQWNQRHQPPENKYDKQQAMHITVTSCATPMVTTACKTQDDINSLSDTLKNVQISGHFQQNGDKVAEIEPKSAIVKMHINIRMENDNSTHESEAINDIENVPNCVQSKSDFQGCKKCSSQAACSNIGYCKLSQCKDGAKVTVFLSKRSDVEKLSNSDGKNGYHENGLLIVANDESCDVKSDEMKTSENHLKTGLHQKDFKVNSEPVSPPGSKPNGKPHEESTPKPSQHFLAQVLLRRNVSSKKKKCRPSAKKRQQIKQKQIPTSTLPPCKKSKLDPSHQEVPSSSPGSGCSPTLKPCSAVAYILGVHHGQLDDNDEDMVDGTNDAARSHSPSSTIKFSFTIGRSIARLKY